MAAWKVQKKKKEKKKTRTLKPIFFLFLFAVHSTSEFAPVMIQAGKRIVEKSQILQRH